MTLSTRRPRRFVGAVVAGMALLLVPATMSAVHAAVDPAPISNLRVVTNPAAPAGELTVRWNASPTPEVTEYMLEIYTDGPWSSTTVEYVGADEDLTFTITGLDPSQAVKVEVTALTADEEGEGFSTPTSIVANTLGDVNEDGTFLDTIGNTFEYQIAWLATSGITTGYDDGTYRPGQPVLREQMAAFIFRSFGGDPEYSGPAQSHFTDVSPSDTFYDEISWMFENGISTGYSNGDGTRSFAPKAPVLREQMAAFIYRAGFFEYSHGVDPASFTDVPRSHAFFDEIEFMALANITTGYREPNGTLTFRGSQPVLREQMAAFLYRVPGAQYSPAFVGINARAEQGKQFSKSEALPEAAPAS